MKRLWSILVAVLVSLLLSCSFAHAQSQQITNGLNYLLSSQNPDGSWSGTLHRGALSTTAGSIETLKVLQQENTASYMAAVSWLQAQEIQTTDQLSARLYALGDTGADRDLLISYIDQLSSAWGGFDDYSVDSLDTSLALLALSKSNYPDQNLISTAIGYITGTQNTDGGWGNNREKIPVADMGC